MRHATAWWAIKVKLSRQTIDFSGFMTNLDNF
jgi:hypothetical protein